MHILPFWKNFKEPAIIQSLNPISEVKMPFLKHFHSAIDLFYHQSSEVSNGENLTPFRRENSFI